MVFRISKWNAPSIAQWRPAQWWSLSARCHRAQEVWRYQNAIAARRDYTKLAQSLRNDRLYFEVDHGSFFTMTVRFIDCKLETMSCTACVTNSMCSKVTSS
mmetsp:Transcript_2117/g.2758  ORF Transcript_2117/g.2758 Transcript_2117/m.2758 type:complete len:101 (+) Transcript_2117:150-452(+)